MKLLSAITAVGLLVPFSVPTSAQSLDQSIRRQLDGLKARLDRLERLLEKNP